MSNQKFTIAEAKRITTKSRTTILKHIHEGTLSAERKDSGKGWTIDASELIRVYGDACDFDRADIDSASISGQEAATPNSPMLKTLLDREKEERDRERQLYRSQIDNLQESLACAQQGLNRVTLLLEDQSTRGGDWEKALKLLSERVSTEQEKASSEIRELKEVSAKREARLKAALEQERSKTLWQRLIGS